MTEFLSNLIVEFADDAKDGDERCAFSWQSDIEKLYSRSENWQMLFSVSPIFCILAKTMYVTTMISSNSLYTEKGDLGGIVSALMKVNFQVVACSKRAK